MQRRSNVDVASNVPSNWWDGFFTGPVVDLWLRIVPDEHTRREVAFIREALGVAPPARVLDVPCGGGRHSLAMAAAGYRVTGVDLSADFLAAARSAAADRGLAVTWDRRPMRDLPWQDEFDGAFCFGNSFGYDTDEGNADFLRAVCRSLRPGGCFVLDYPSVLEAVLPGLPERSWFDAGDVLFLEDQHYDAARGGIVTEYTFLRDGKADRRPGFHRCYTYREVCGLLRAAAFGEVRTYGSLAQEPFAPGSRGLFLVATKPAARAEAGSANAQQ
jgi:SAM-dependent methyltransferase